MIVITAKALYTPLECIEQPSVVVEDGRIVQISQRSGQIPRSATLMDFGEDILAPGFVDIHIHGGAGHDVMDLDPQGLAAVERFIAAHGVTSYCPTTVTAPVEQTLRALERLADAIETARSNEVPQELRATPLGIHLEGPFLSHARRGVHPPDDLLPPTLKMFERFWEAARGHIRIMTIAPELDGSLEVIEAASKRSVCVSMGHSDADMARARAAVAAGARHATHTFNGMRPLDHRQPGILGEVLTNPRITAEIIADGIHLDPLIVKLVLQTKGLDGAVFITDSTSGAGMPDGRYRLGSFEFEVNDGRAVSDGKLAGSILTMDHAVQNAMRFAGIDLQAALRPATANPARVAGINDLGVLKPGAAADFIVLSAAGEVKKTIIRGRVV
jgi:N-acetylglucosamine-6-phosphate deacetylase